MNSRFQDTSNKGHGCGKKLENDYGLCNPFVSGLSSTSKPKVSQHKLETALRDANDNKLRQDMTILRKTQGLHAPMRLAMELKATQKIGRLPFLSSSYASRDSLLQRDEMIGPEDIFNTPEFKEQMGQPHAIVEKSFGLL